MRLLNGCNILALLFIQFALSEFITTGIGRIELLKELGRGSFGVVRKCRVESTGRNCAIKMELSSDGSTLPMERKCYQALGDHPGIPRMLFFGKYEEGTGDVLVLELVGPSLMDIIEQKRFDKFSLKTILLLGIQILYRTEFIHSRGILFMDHKPENWVVGGNDVTKSLIHVLDFGLSVFYIKDGKHVEEGPEVVGGASAGTLRYISVYAHRHTTVSRRDDIESLLYVLIYLYRGDVRWASRSGDKSEGKSERVLRLKLDTSFEELAGEDAPHELRLFMDYARSLSFYQRPNYDYLRRLLRDALAKIPANEDNLFDWSEAPRIIQIPQKENGDYFWNIPESVPPLHELYTKSKL